MYFLSKTKHSLVVIIIFTFIPSICLSTEYVKLYNNKFEEIYRKNTPVGGNIILGVSSCGYEKEDMFSLLQPKSKPSENICLEITSRDGSYKSDNTYILPESTKESLVPIEYPTKYKNYLLKFDYDELAVLTKLGKCNENNENIFLISAINKYCEKKDNLMIHVFVNSKRSDAFISIKNNLTNTYNSPSQCVPIYHGNRTVFDNICFLSIKNDDDIFIKNGDDFLIKCKIILRRRDKLSSTYTFSIMLPQIKILK